MINGQLMCFLSISYLTYVSYLTYPPKVYLHTYKISQVGYSPLYQQWQVQPVHPLFLSWQLRPNGLRNKMNMPVFIDNIRHKRNYCLYTWILIRPNIIIVTRTPFALTKVSFNCCCCWSSCSCSCPSKYIKFLCFVI